MFALRVNRSKHEHETSEGKYAGSTLLFGSKALSALDTKGLEV